MSKSVLISIQPKWCELIAKGKKTVEVRKSRPKIDTPFKCYIYCAEKGIDIYGDGKSYVTDYSKLLEKGAKKGFETASGFFKWNGKIIGEFICDDITKFAIDPKYDNLTLMSMANRSCLSKSQLEDYCSDYWLYGWHISDLKIYDKPRELSEFGRYDKPIICPQVRCGKCGHWKYMRVNADEYDYDCDCNGLLDNFFPLRRPPQSWCYVEEREDNA